MPEVSRFYGIIIAFYYNEHNPPHFHAKYGEFRAEVDIRTLQILNGDLPKRAKSMVLEWADEHRNELMHNWELARQNNELNAIEPLK
jgi:phosphomannomutase